MTAYDLGDGVNLDHFVYDRDDNPVAATVVLTVTNPNGVTTTPSITTPSVGHYRAATFTANVVGNWSYAWTVSGAVTDVSPGYFVVQDPAPQPYVSLPQMKAYLKIADDLTRDDDLIAAALDSVSLEIDNVCERTFTRDLVATARTFPVRETGLLRVDDFYSTTGLIIDGTAYSSSTWTLRPYNGIVHGRRGWPYNSIVPTADGTGTLTYGDTITITALWGWADVPAAITEACKIATADTFGAKDARFGVAGYGEFGPMRVRDNGMVMAKLKPYMRNVWLGA